MKVIDLLNKIAKDKKIPKRIKHKGVIYKYQQEARNYAYKGANSYYCWFLSETIADVTSLYDEVEIIEDEDEEIDIDTIKEFDKYKEDKRIFNYTGKEGEKSNLYSFSLWASFELINKVNDLVKAVKHLNKKIKEKE